MNYYQCKNITKYYYIQITKHQSLIFLPALNFINSIVSKR